MCLLIVAGYPWTPKPFKEAVAGPLFRSFGEITASYPEAAEGKYVAFYFSVALHSYLSVNPGGLTAASQLFYFQCCVFLSSSGFFNNSNSPPRVIGVDRVDNLHPI